MQLAFYVITRTDGGIVDTYNETPYLIANDYEQAEELVDKLPADACGYNIEFALVDTGLVELELIATYETRGVQS